MITIMVKYKTPLLDYLYYFNKTSKIHYHFINKIIYTFIQYLELGDMYNDFYKKVEYVTKNCEKKEYINDIINKYSNHLAFNFINKDIIKHPSLYILKYTIVTEEFLDEFGDKIGWEFIGCIVKLTNNIIKKHANKFVLEDLLLNQELSEEIIILFLNKIFENRYRIALLIRFQKLSKNFIINHRDVLLYDDIYVHYLITYQNISSSFISNHKYE